MKKITARVAVVAVLATALVAGMATNANAAGTNATQVNGSDGPLYIWNGANTATISSGGYDTTAIAAGSKSDATAPLACPSTSEGAATFVSKRGNERRPVSTATGSALPNGWISQGSASFTSGTKNVAGANIKISGITVGSPTDVKAAGDYSLGVACVSSSGAVVDRVFYAWITTTGSAGDWTAAATDYSYPTPTLSYTLAGSSLHTGDTITASVGADSAVPDQFAPSYQWYAGTTPIANATNASYVLADTDGGKVFHVTVSYTRSGYTTVTRDSANTVTVQGNTNLGGSITVTAGVVNALDGQLSLDVAPKNGSYAGAVTLTGTRNTLTNQSESTGNLPELTVTDGRVTSLGGWSLSATVSDFQRVIPGSPLSTADVIAKTQLGITPSITSKPADRTVNAGTARAAGDAFNSAFVLASTDAVATPGSSDKAYTGDTVVTAALKLVAPRWKTAGNYQSTMTVTLTQ